MDRFQNTLREYLKNHEKHKKYIAVLMALSLIITFMVPLGLTERADSMTVDTLGGAILATPLVNAIADEGAIKSREINDSNCSELKISINVNRNPVYGYEKNDDHPGGAVIVGGDGVNMNNNDPVDVKFSLEYAFVDMILTETDKDEAEGKNGKPKWFFKVSVESINNVLLTMAARDGEKIDVRDANYEGPRAGYFVIDSAGDSKYAYIYLEPDYITYIMTQQKADSEQTGEVKGTLSFSAEMNRGSSDSNNAGFIFAGMPVTLKYPTREIPVTKQGFVNTSKGEIEWTVRVNNSDGLNLKDYYVKDTMFSEGVEILSVTDGYGMELDYSFSDEMLQFDEHTQSEVTIRYKTKITPQLVAQAQDNSWGLTNEVKVFNKNDPSNPKSENYTTVQLNKPTITKSATPDYANGNYGHMMTWTVVINNDSGIDLDGYEIKDSRVTLGSNATVVVPSGGSISGGKLQNVGNARVIKFTYETVAEESKDGSANRNKIDLINPSTNEVIDTNTQTPVYKEEKALYKVTKDGSYNPDTGEITWQVTVEAEGTMQLTGYKLTDAKFPNSMDGFTFSSGNSSNVTYDAGSKTMTFSGGQRYSFTYKTKKDMSSTASTDSNEATLNNKNNEEVAKGSKTVDIPAYRTKVSKGVSAGGDQTVGTNKATKKTIKWTVNITNDQGFKDKTFNDTLEIANRSGISTSVKNVKVYVGTTKNNKSLVSSSLYDVTQTGDNFKIDFKNIDPKYHYMTIEYETEVSFPEVNDSHYDSSGSDSITFTNTGEFGGVKGVGTTGITRVNPNQYRNSIQSKKEWDGVHDSRPRNVTVVVGCTRTANGNSETVYLMGDNSSNYTFVKDESQAQKYTIDSGSSWLKSWNGLPSQLEQGNTIYTYSNYFVKEITFYHDIDDHRHDFNGDNYVDTTNGVVVKTEVNTNGVWLITNKYYPDIKFNVEKKLAGDKYTNIQKIVVTLQRQSSATSTWTDIGDYDIIKDGNGNFKLEITNPSANNGLFKTIDYQEGHNPVYYNYRIVEKKIVTMDNHEYEVGTVATSDGNVTGIIVDQGDDKGYFVVSDGTVVGADYCDRLPTNINGADDQKVNYDFTNSFKKTNPLEIGVTKVWDDLNDEESNRPVKLNFELQRRQKGTAGSWTALASQEIDVNGTPIEEAKNWTYYTGHSAEEVVSQEIVDGNVIIYEYRVVESGFTPYNSDEFGYDPSNPNTVKLSGTTASNYPEITRFATNPTGGVYEAYYDKTSLLGNGTVTITNKLVKPDTVNLRARKKWLDDTAFGNRPDKVTLVLESRGGPNKPNTWDEYKVGGSTLQIELTSDDYENSYDVVNNGVWWTLKNEDVLNQLKGLPTSWNQRIEDADGNVRYEKKTIYYRFVETSVTYGSENNNISYKDSSDRETGETKRFQNTTNVSDPNYVEGKYIVINERSQVDSKGDTILNVENTFEENIGINKTVIDPNGNPVSVINRDELENPESNINKLYKKKIDGEDYYVFTWFVTFDSIKKELFDPVVDKLPEGFSLITEISSNDDLYREQYYKFDGTSIQYAAMDIGEMLSTPITIPSYGTLGGDGYLAIPFAFYKVYGWDGSLNLSGSFANSMRVAGPNQSGRSTPAGYTYTDEISDVFAYWHIDATYYYDRENNVVYFSEPVTFDGVNVLLTYCYSTKIKCSDLLYLCKDGSYTISNNAEKWEQRSGEERPTHGTGDTASASVTIKAPSTLMKKSYAETNIPGIVQYTLDINPDARTLANGTTIDVSDVFKTISYTVNSCESHNGRSMTGDRLVDIILSSLKVYEVDANGAPTRLSANQYIYQFKNGLDADGDAAKLLLQVPDGKHIKVVYNYKFVANENTPSVIWQCKSTTEVDFKYPIMAPGMSPSEGDVITFRNDAYLDAGSNFADATAGDQSYRMTTADATISVNARYKIQKVNVADYSINDLAATFLLAKYNNGGWYYATDITSKGKITWKNEASIVVPEAEAYAIKLNGSPRQLSLEDGMLYKLVEVGIPDKYEGSDLKYKDEYGQLQELDEADYTQLIVQYVNTKNEGNPNTIYKGYDYKNFLDTFVFSHYFVYGVVDASGVVKPDDVATDDIQVVQIGDAVNVPNNELINIGLEKEWNGRNNPDDFIEVQLFYSHSSDTKNFPGELIPATAEALGLLEYEGFEPIKNLPMTALGDKIWTGLPNGQGIKPIYYYVKEIGYTIDDIRYRLDKDGNYYRVESVDGDNVTWAYDSTNNKIQGSFYPTYVGNAVCTNDTVTIKNSQQLKLVKIWHDANNKPLKPGKIPVNRVTMDIYGIKNDGSREKVFADIEIIKGMDDTWYTDITDKLTTAILESLDSYVSYEADEKDEMGQLINMGDFINSCTFNINNGTGEITVYNKNINAVDASVFVNKSWSDGEAKHKGQYVVNEDGEIEEDQDGNKIYLGDSITITLLQSDKKINVESDMSLDELKALGAVAPVLYDDDGNKIEEISEDFYKIVLNSEDGWSYSWSGLPLDDGNETNPKPYYYYVYEDMTNVNEARKYTTVVAKDPKESSNSKTVYNITNERSSFNVEKRWFDENGIQIDTPDNINSVNVKVYKEAAEKSSLKIQAYGDSITAGSDWNESNATYATNTYLGANLKSSEYGSYSDVTINNNSQGGEAIDWLSGKKFESNTDAICIMLGTNNILHWHYGIRYGEGNHDLESMIKQLKANDSTLTEKQQQDLLKSIPIYLATIPYIDCLNNYAKAKNGDIFTDWMSTYDGMNFANGTQEKQDELDRRVDAYNAYVRSVASNLNADGYRVSIVDINSKIKRPTDFYDGCHLSTSGVAKMGVEFAAAISSDTQKQYLKKDNTFTSNPNEKGVAVYSITAENDWKLTIDLPAGNTDVKFGVEEVVPEGWDVSYENNSQKPCSETPAVVNNTQQPAPKVSLSVVKTWESDGDGSSRPEDIVLGLLQAPQVMDREANISPGEWREMREGVEYTKTASKPSGSNKWTYTFTGLQAADKEGNPYYYKIEESAVPKGYEVTYYKDAEGQEKIDDIDAYEGLQAEAEGSGFKESIGSLYLTNKRTMSLTFKKTWSDIDENDHIGDTVTLKVYRSTSYTDVPEAEMILTAPENESVGVGKSTTIEVNKELASIEVIQGEALITAEIDDTDHTKINIQGVASGTAVIKVATENDRESAEITVKVSDLQVTVDAPNNEIEAGSTANLTAKLHGIDTTDVTYSKYNKNIIKVNDNGVIEAKAIGETTITATADGEETTITVKVILPKNFTITGEGTVTVGGTANFSISEGYQYGTFRWEAYPEDAVTIQSAEGDQNGYNVVITGGDDLVNGVQIKAIRNDDNKESQNTLSIDVVSGIKTGTIPDTNYTYAYDPTQNTVVIEGTYGGNPVDLGGIKNDAILMNLTPTRVDTYPSFDQFVDGDDWMNLTEGSIELTAGKKFSQFTSVKLYRYNTTTSVKITFKVTAPPPDPSPMKAKLKPQQSAPDKPQTIINPAIIPNGLKNDGELEPFMTVELKNSDNSNWEKTIDNLPTRDENGETYYYWVVEEGANGYEALYRFTDDDELTEYCINADKSDNALIEVKNIKTETEGIEMPSTGGSGTKSYTAYGLLIIGGALGMLTIRKRRRRCCVDE